VSLVYVMFYTAIILYFTTYIISFFICFFFQAEDGIRDRNVTGVQTCALPISYPPAGTSLIVYKVSFLVNENILGPKPIANSRASIPAFLAKIKWPHS